VEKQVDGERIGCVPKKTTWKRASKGKGKGARELSGLIAKNVTTGKKIE